jgi:hypothetical protein
MPRGKRGMHSNTDAASQHLVALCVELLLERCDRDLPPPRPSVSSAPLN